MKKLLLNSNKKTIDKRLTNILTARRSVSSTSRSQKLTIPSLSARIVEMGNNPTPLTRENITNVYLKKCKMLDLDFNEEACQHFVDQLFVRFKEKTIDFSGLSLGYYAFCEIVTLFSANLGRSVLKLSSNRIEDTGIISLSSFMETNPPVILLDLRSNLIGSSGSAALFRSLKNNTHLVYLDVSSSEGVDRNKIGRQGSIELSNFIAMNEVIEELHLSDVGLNEECCKMIGEALPKNQSIRVLDLSGNSFGYLGALSLFHLPGCFASITTLDISRNRISDIGTKSLCLQLIRNSILVNLNLCDNDLGYQFLKSFYSSIKLGTSIKRLNLSKNHFDSKCSDYLILILRDFPTIKCIDLSHNPLRDECAVEVLRTISENTNLKYVDISGTQITDNSRYSLSKIISKSKKIKWISLASNKLTDSTGVLISKELETNNKIEYINLKNNEFADETAFSLIKALENNETINDIEVSYNDFGYKSYVHLVNYLKARKDTRSKAVITAAKRKLEDLRESERILKESKVELGLSHQKSEQMRIEKEMKMKEFCLFKEQKDHEILQTEQYLAELKLKYTKLIEDRKMQLDSFNKKKAEIEEREKCAMEAHQDAAAKKYYSLNRLTRAETKKLDAAVASSQILTELKLHISSLKDHAKLAIEELKIAKRAAIEENEQLERQKKEEKQKNTVPEKKKNTSRLSMPIISARKQKKTQ